jgi:hypothetical protein
LTTRAPVHARTIDDGSTPVDALYTRLELFTEGEQSLLAEFADTLESTNATHVAVVAAIDYYAPTQPYVYAAEGATYDLAFAPVSLVDKILNGGWEVRPCVVPAAHVDSAMNVPLLDVYDRLMDAHRAEPWTDEAHVLSWLDAMPIKGPYLNEESMFERVLKLDASLVPLERLLESRDPLKTRALNAPLVSIPTMYPLGYAISRNDAQRVQLLLRHGAKPLLGYTIHRADGTHTARPAIVLLFECVVTSTTANSNATVNHDILHALLECMSDETIRSIPRHMVDRWLPKIADAALRQRIAMQ